MDLQELAAMLVVAGAAAYLLRRLGLRVRPAPPPIQPVVLGDRLRRGLARAKR